MAHIIFIIIHDNPPPPYTHTTGLHEGGVVGQDSGCDRSGPQQAAQRSRGSALLGSTGVCVCVCVCVCLYRHDYIHIRVYMYSLACLYECVGRHVYM
jgi:hypothetical protein